MERAGEREDQAVREQRLRLLASFGCRVTKAAMAIANSEMWTIVLRFSTDFLFLTQSRSWEVALNWELYRSHSVLRAYEYIKQKVDVRLTRCTVEVFFGGTRIASHPRLLGRPNQYSTNESHMPPEHQEYLQ